MRSTVRAGHILPCAVKMAARTGLTSSYVKVDREMKACRNARLLLLYRGSSSSDILPRFAIDDGFDLYIWKRSLVTVDFNVDI